MNLIHPLTPAERAQGESALRAAMHKIALAQLPDDYYDDAPMDRDNGWFGPECGKCDETDETRHVYHGYATGEYP